MCRSLGLPAVLLGLLLAAPASAIPAGATWAVLVGISKYNTASIQPLSYAAADATAMRDALVDPQLGGLTPDHVALLTDGAATAVGINMAVDGFLNAHVRPGDQVLIFLAGHGVTKGVGAGARGFFLPADVRGLTLPALDASAIDLQSFSDRIGRLPASQFVVFVDACREDPTPGRGIKDNPLSDVISRGLQVVPQNAGPPASSVTFFACQVGERAYEDVRLQHGVFTNFILDAIRTGAVPHRPDGAVEMGSLGAYVGQKVTDWAQGATRAQQIEYDQTPTLVATAINGPVVIMDVRRPIPEMAIQPPPGRLSVATQPGGADLRLDGQALGASPVSKMLPAGDYHLQAEAPGYQPLDRPVKLLDGYDLQVGLQLSPVQPPGSTGGSQAAALFQQGMAAEAQLQEAKAETAYAAAIQADPLYGDAYQRLADLYLRQNRNEEAVSVLVSLVGRVPPDAHSYSILAHAYGVLAVRGTGDEKGQKINRKPQAMGYRVTGDPEEAAKYAKTAATEATRADATSAEALLALGFALVASDTDGKNREKALAAFEQAVALQPSNPATHYGLGYGLRVYAPPDKKESLLDRSLSPKQAVCQGDARTQAIQRDITEQTRALALRPGFFEAQRELAYCYQLLDQDADAVRAYKRTNALRAAGSDRDQFAAVNVALCALHEKRGRALKGAPRRQYQDAARGYLDDARELASDDLTRALQILQNAGLKSRIYPYLPNRLQNLWDNRDRFGLPDPFHEVIFGSGQGQNPERSPAPRPPTFPTDTRPGGR